MLALQIFLRSPRARKALGTKIGDEGFSLIELVVVIAILGILIAVALPNFLGVQKDAKISQAQNALVNIVKECAVKETRTGSTSVGETQTPGTGTDMPVQAAFGKVNGYDLKEVTAPGTAFTAFPTVGEPFTGQEADKDMSCYNVAAISQDGNLPSFSVEFDQGQTVKMCEVTADTTYVGGCFDPDESGNVLLPKETAGIGKW